MAAKVSVTSVELCGSEIRIEWSDGHSTRYDAKYLRINCGCAQCVEEWSRRKLLDPATVPAATSTSPASTRSSCSAAYASAASARRLSGGRPSRLLRASGLRLRLASRRDCLRRPPDRTGFGAPSKTRRSFRRSVRTGGPSRQ